jgi:transcriptional regulator with XRE-family HTH domain
MPKSIGEQIKEARKSQGINQVQLASKSIVSLSTIGALERGQSDTTTINIRRFQKALNIKIEL